MSSLKVRNIPIFQMVYWVFCGNIYGSYASEGKLCIVSAGLLAAECFIS